VLLAAFAAAALFAPWLTPYATEGMGAPNMPNKLLPPSPAHPFGADEMGRDVLARVLFGARTSLALAVLVIGGSALVGIVVGLSAGYAGGTLDAAAMRVADVFLAFPPLLLAILLVTVWGGGLLSAALALALAWWPTYALLVRDQVLRLRRQPFVEAAQAVGAPPLRIVRRHLLPNALGPLLTQAAVDAGAVILLAAGLSFVGLGPQPPTADWGMMINSGRLYVLSGHWWVAAWPGVAIMLTALGFTLLGDSLRA
jgi:peptide/nickel transport system permease protein